jgi:drug/metabolite transporter (DMT)-like permease
VPDRPLVHAPRSHVLLAFAAVYVVWGSTYLAIRIAIETIPPFFMVGARFCVAGGILYAWARAHGEERPTPVHWRSATIVGVLLLVLGTGVVVWAEEKVASGIAALLVSVEPLWIVLLQWLRPRGKRPSAWVICGLVLGLAGLWLLVNPTSDGGAQRNVVAEGILLLAALSWAVGTLYSKRAPLPTSKFIGTAMEMLAAGAVLVAVGLVTGEAGHLALGAVSARSWGALLYLVVFGSIVGYTAYIWLVNTVSPTLVSTYAFVNPVVAVVLGWAIVSEPLNVRMIVAAAIIVGAVALITIGGTED